MFYPIKDRGEQAKKFKGGLGGRNFLPASRRVWFCQPVYGKPATKIQRRDFREKKFGFCSGQTANLY